MNELTIIEIGNVQSKAQAEKLREKLQGKTFYNFNVEYSPFAGNYPVSVSTDRPDSTEKELTEMVLFYLACEI